jgi:hypothetical protein
MHVPTYADLRAMGAVEGLSGRLVEMGDSPPSRCGRDIARMILVGDTKVLPIPWSNCSSLALLL